jgi:AcrR family transcriptional regulator
VPTTTKTDSTARRRGPSKGDLKERAILVTAERLLAKKSLHEISVDELARGAKISRPTFYFYFESKFAVVRTLVEEIVEDTYSAALRWLERTDEPPDEAIRSSIEVGTRHWRDHGPVLRAAVQTLDIFPEMERFWEAITRRFVDAVAVQIDREREAGLAPDGPPSARALATALIWMDERCFYTASLGTDPSLSYDELIETLTTVWLRSIYGTDKPVGQPPVDRVAAAPTAA